MSFVLIQEKKPHNRHRKMNAKMNFGIEAEFSEGLYRDWYLSFSLLLWPNTDTGSISYIPSAVDARFGK